MKCLILLLRRKQIKKTKTFVLEKKVYFIYLSDKESNCEDEDDSDKDESEDSEESILKLSSFFVRPVDLWRVDVLFCEDEPSLFSFLIRNMFRLDIPVRYAALSIGFLLYFLGLLIFASYSSLSTKWLISNCTSLLYIIKRVESQMESKQDSAHAVAVQHTLPSSNTQL